MSCNLKRAVQTADSNDVDEHLVYTLPPFSSSPPPPPQTLAYTHKYMSQSQLNLKILIIHYFVPMHTDDFFYFNFFVTSSVQKTSLDTIPDFKFFKIFIPWLLYERFTLKRIRFLYVCTTKVHWPSSIFKFQFVNFCHNEIWCPFGGGDNEKKYKKKNEITKFELGQWTFVVHTYKNRTVLK